MSTEFARWMRDTSFACGLVLATAVIGSGQDGTQPAEPEPLVQAQSVDKTPASETRSTVTSTTTQSSVEIQSEIATSDKGQPAEPVTRQVKIIQQSQSGPSGKTATTKGHVRIVGPDGVIKEFDIEDLSDAAKSLQIGTDGYEIRTLKTPDGETRVLTVIFDGNGAIVPSQPKAAGQAAQPTKRPPSDRVQVDKSVSIGIVLQPLSEALKSQLQLKLGLVIAKVMPNSPASEAGLQPYDILLMAGESTVTDHPALLQAVQESEGKPLKLTILRAGQKQHITVTPRQQTLVTASPDTPQAEIADLLRQLQLDGNSSIRLQVVRPGIMAKDVEELEQVRDKMRQVREQLDVDRKLLEERVKSLKERHLQTQKTPESSDLRLEVDALRKQVQELQKSLKKLQTETKPAADNPRKQKAQK